MATWPAVIPAITPLVLPGAAGPGTVATTGTTVTGTATTFIATFNVGDTMVSSAGDGRSIVSIASNTSMVITAAFSPDLPGGTTYTKGAVCNVPIEAVSEWQPIVEALCTYLGINPQDIYADVATRLAAMATAIAGKLSTESDPLSLHVSGGSNTMGQDLAMGGHDITNANDVHVNGNIDIAAGQQIIGAGNLIVQGSTLTLEGSAGGTIDFQVPTQGTVGAAGGGSALPATPVGYLKIKVATVDYVIPYFNH